MPAGVRLKTNRIYNGVEAETRKSQASFQIILSYARLADHELNNLKTSLRFPCRGLNPIIDYVSHALFQKNKTEKPFRA